MSETILSAWAVRTALGGSALLLLGWFGMRWFQAPALRQRWGEWALVSATLCAIVAALPAWWVISIPISRTDSAIVEEANQVSQKFPARQVFVVPLDAAIVPNEPEVIDHLPEVIPAKTVMETSTFAVNWTWRNLLLVGYGTVAVGMLAHWILANLAVWWLLQRRCLIPQEVSALFVEMAWPRCIRLIVTDRVDVPFSVGLFRPTVVLPKKLIEEATTEELRWVFAHELTHVARHDTKTCWLFILGQVLFFYVPWYWWLRRHVRLSQEYVADAAALEWAGSPADYAQFLVSWAVRPRGSTTDRLHRLPVVVTPVTGSGSDLFRRVTMMLESKNTGETRVSRSWLLGLASGLVALGLVVGGVGLKAVAAEDDKTEKKNELPKKPAVVPQLADEFEKIFENFGIVDDEVAKELRERMDEVRKQMEELRKQMEKGNFQFQGQFPGGAIAFPGGAIAMPGGAFGLAVNPKQQRLGAQIRTPSSTLVEQLDLPKDQGLVLEEVGPNSAAAKAGMKSHDVLLEIDGKTVPNKPEAFVKMLSEIEANKPIDAVVLRKGKRETVKGLTLPEVKPTAVTNVLPFGNPIQALPVVPGRPGLRALAQAGGRGTSTSMVRNNDDFTTKYKEDDLSITIKGKIDSGQAKVSEVLIDEGNGQSATYDSLDKVPSKHREKVKKLAEMSAKGNVTLPLK